MITEFQPRQKPAKGQPAVPAICLVIHAAERPAEACIDGRGFVIPPNEVWEVQEIRCTDHNPMPYEYVTPAHEVMRRIMEQAWSFGLVEVPTIQEKGKYGFNYKFDEEAAHALAEQALINAEEKVLQHYVTIQRERLNLNLAAMPPTGRVAEVIEKRRIDLQKEYNLNPVGFGTVAKAAAASEEMAALKTQLDIQARENAELRQMMARIVTTQESLADSKKGK